MDYKFIPAKYYFEGWKENPRLIVIHWIAGSYRGAIETFRQGLSKASAHFIVSKEGLTTQMVKLTDRAWHAGISKTIFGENANNYSFGIELEGPPSFVREKSWPLKQLVEASNICIYLKEKYPSIEYVTDHSFISPGRKIDVRGSTGKDIDIFPWNDFVELTGLKDLT